MHTSILDVIVNSIIVSSAQSGQSLLLGRFEIVEPYGERLAVFIGVLSYDGQVFHDAGGYFIAGFDDM